MLGSRLCRHAVLPALLAVAGASFGEGAQDVRFTWEIAVEASGGPPIPATRTTYMVQGERQRIQVVGMRPYTILQCDLARQVHVDPDRNSCCVYPLHSGGGRQTAQAVGGTGGTVKVEGTYRSSGERREILGFEAAKATYRHAVTASDGACSYRPGRYEFAGEGWFADLPSSVRPYGCTFGDQSPFDAGLRTWAADCEDEVETDLVGDPSSLQGLLLSGTSTATMMGRTTKTRIEATELSLSPLDPTLFEPPAGCRCPSGMGAEAATEREEAPEQEEPEVAATEPELIVEETEAEVTIALAAEVLFDFDKADLRPAAHETLERLAELLRGYRGASLRIEGHTDALGSEGYNLWLSRRRSEAVRDWLVEIAAIDAATIETVGLGETRPVAPNTRPDGGDDPDGRQRNRRVEVKVRK